MWGLFSLQFLMCLSGANHQTNSSLALNLSSYYLKVNDIALKKLHGQMTFSRDIFRMQVKAEDLNYENYSWMWRWFENRTSTFLSTDTEELFFSGEGETNGLQPSQSANRFQKPIKSVNTFGDAPSANNTLACFQWWTSIAFPDWTEAAGKCFCSTPSRPGTMGRVWTSRLACWRTFCYPEISRETKPKKKKKAPTTAEREPRIKTNLSAAEK